MNPLNLSTFIVFTLFAASATTALTCFQCTTSEGSDYCVSSFPKPSQCLPLMNYCTKIITTSNGAISVLRSCNVVSLDNTCMETGTGKICSFSCDTDACNAGSQFHCNRFQLPFLLTLF
uniref:U-scoloptoxin(05)-Cw1a n=1 Tax=Cormocephalus westwoodi TaxID=1096223 RepID=TX51A_CORWE|nr:RecName: Full=U-scoloptoxin(05)-Cw1a; Short=U-SLPTX(05)-Cw1a; Flags: Precursor [Cormocephalus westwoodi]